MSAMDTSAPYAPPSDVITDDQDFLKHTKFAKKLLDMDIDQLVPQQAELLRVEIAKIVQYVMSKVEEEEPEPTPVPETYLQDKSSMGSAGGGRRKKQGKSSTRSKRTGGASMDNRIMNVGNIVNPNHDPYALVEKSPDIAVGSSVHKAFTSGNSTSFSSVDGMPKADVNSMLLPLGTVAPQTGGKTKKARSSRKHKA